MPPKLNEATKTVSSHMHESLSSFKTTHQGYDPFYGRKMSDQEKRIELSLLSAEVVNSMVDHLMISTMEGVRHNIVVGFTDSFGCNFAVDSVDLAIGWYRHIYDKDSIEYNYKDESSEF